MARSQTSKPSDLSSLVPALSKVLERVGNAPIRLEVALCDAEDLAAAKSRILELEAEVERYKQALNRSEYLLGCMTFENGEMMDTLRAHGLPIPRRGR